LKSPKVGISADAETTLHQNRAVSAGTCAVCVDVYAWLDGASLTDVDWQVTPTCNSPAVTHAIAVVLVSPVSCHLSSLPVCLSANATIIRHTFSRECVMEEEEVCFISVDEMTERVWDKVNVCDIVHYSACECRKIISCCQVICASV